MKIRTSRRAAPAARTRLGRARQRGQALVMFVAGIVFVIGLMALVVDVTWAWMNMLRVQRAADAAALAGAVKLPDYPSQARTLAYAEATKNGYTSGINGATVTAAQNPTRDIQLDTSVTAPVRTFFLHLVGINTITVSRRAAAEYVLPVPMGSPLNYFGAFGPLRGWIHTDTGRDIPDPGDIYPTGTRTPYAASGWTGTTNAGAIDLQYAVATNTTNAQGFAYNVPARLYGTAQQYLTLGGIKVTVRGHSDKATTCTIKVDVTPNNGTNWYGSSNPYALGESGTPGASQTLGLTDTNLTFGGDQSTSGTDTGHWFGYNLGWSSTKLNATNFGVRITPVNNTCTYSIDAIGVKVTYEGQDPPVVGPNGESLVAQGVWATVNSQGSGTINGDAYSSQGLIGDGSGTSTQYNPTGYYDYAFEMEPGTTNGTIYVFDPVFCATSGNGDKGMGDRWYSTTVRNPMSTFYDVYSDPNNTPYDLTDDTWVAGAGNLFRRSAGTDTDQGGPSVGAGMYDCRKGKVTNPASGGYWHNRWYPIATGLAGPTGATPKIYRIHVTATDPNSATDQRNTNGQNSFSFFGSVQGHTCPTSPADLSCPRVYGLGAMQAFSPLSPSTSVDMYFAQISAAYAGKTMKVSLWDPGDTNLLAATLSFQMPTTSGYTAAPFTWTASRFVPSGSNCNGSSSGTVTSLVTNTGGSSRFNGCWVVINVAVPAGYTAPDPSGLGPGWWKIRYSMGSGTSPAFDVTTWKTQLIGNPVHLVVP